MQFQASMDIKQYLAQKRAIVEEALEVHMLAADGRLVDHIKAMRYSLFAGGKRVRPILCIAAAEALNGMPIPLLPIACAFECIHTYSLIHDDLPAMDDDDLRRGKPTNHVVFGEAEAILAGDGLMTYAFELLSNPTLSDHIGDADRLRLIHLVAQAAGSLGMVGGQALDVAAEGKAVEFDTLRFIHSCKTGALITAAIQAGAIIGGANEGQFASLTTYGQKVGLAFQIVDDLLNVVGSAEELGKAAGSDADRQKATYPAFFGVEGTRARAEEAVNGAVAALAGFDAQADPLRELALYIYTRTT
jgi:geranylgeranyl diphosphate synthase type II